MGEKVTAYVLPEDAATVTGEAQVFPGFPGEFVPGEPVAYTDLGFATVKEADAKIAELNLPLRKATGKDGAEPRFAAGEMISGADVPSAPDADFGTGDDDDRSPMPGVTAAEFEELRREPNPSPVIETLAAAEPAAPPPAADEGANG